MFGVSLLSSASEKRNFVLELSRLFVHNWDLAVILTFLNGVIRNTIECARLCLAGFNQNVSQCNAFVYDKSTSTCNLTNFTFLEDPQAGIVYQVRAKIGCWMPTSKRNSLHLFSCRTFTSSLALKIALDFNVMVGNLVVSQTMTAVCMKVTVKGTKIALVTVLVVAITIV